MYMCVITAEFVQFLCEMAAAWQFSVDSRIGIFEEDKKRPDPLAKAENEILGPDPPFAKPHHIWTQVHIKRGRFCYST